MKLGYVCTGWRLQGLRSAFARFMKEEAKKILEEQSIHPLLRLMFNFPFLYITHYLSLSSEVIGFLCFDFEFCLGVVVGWP